MSAYANLPLEAWEEKAREVCGAIDQKVKTMAQQFFLLFIQTPNFDLLTSLLEQGSDLLLFSIFSYITKYPTALVGDCRSFQSLLNLISRWELRQFTFVRPQQPPCQGFVTRTGMQALGTMMKILYEKKETSEELLEFLKGLPLNFLKVYILKTFIETVEVVDSEMGYMRFRTMVYSFQDNVIPVICEILMPFFYAFEEGLKINELSFLQSRMDVNENTHSTNHSQVSLSKEQQMQSEYVLMLLKKIVEFNYNITYTEYESEQIIDTCLVTFPDKVLQKIIHHEFLNSLFYVVEKVCESRCGQHKNEYLSIVLDCLAKIMQARLGYVSQQRKQKFVCAAVKGLTHLLQICQQLQSQILLEGILVCNKKLLMSVELGYIKKVLETDEESNNNQLYKIFLRDLSWMLLHIFKKSYVHTQNSLLYEALEVSNKIVGHLGYRDQESMDDSAEFYLSLAKDIVSNYVHNLCHPRCIFPTPQVLWVSDNKQAVSGLFQHFKKLSSYVYYDLFSTLDYCLENYANEHRQELATFANLLFLLSELVDRHFLERNINLNKAKDAEIAILAMTVKKASMLVQEYIANRSNFRYHKDQVYLDVAVLLFTESLLIEFLNSFEVTPVLKIKQKIYLMMVFGQSYNDELEQEDNSSEQTIGVYLNVIFQFLESDVEGTDAEAKMIYALQVIEKVIFKLKWNMRRQSFLKCQIFRQMLTFFDQYFTRCHKTPLIMAKVGKITVSLNFDDILDQYKFRINKFISKLPKNDARSVFYYLTGIFEGIEPGNIFRYFCFQLKKEINLSSFFHQIFKMSLEANTDKDYRDICKFCRLIVLNKGLKHANNSSLVYEIFGLILPHLIWFIQTINDCQNINLDILGDAICELIQLFCGIVNGTHVNIFVLDESIKTEKNTSQTLLGYMFVTQFLKLMILINPQIKQYPKLEELCLNCFVSANKQILEYIYDHENSKMSDIYNFLMLKQIDLAVDYIILQLNGNRLVEDKLLKIVDSVRIFYQYINRKGHIVHKRNIITNLKKYCEMSEAYNQENECKVEKLAFYSVSLILTNHKNNVAYIRSISKLVYQLNKRYRRYLIHTFEKLIVNRAKINEVETILEKYCQDIEQNFIEYFKVWIKECNEFK